MCCKGWIFLLINKEITPLWICKLLLRKWPRLLGAVSEHKINTQADCLLHSEANTSHSSSDWSGGWNTIPSLLKELRVCYTDFLFPDSVTKDIRHFSSILWTWSLIKTNLAKSQRQRGVELRSFSDEHFSSPFFVNFSLTVGFTDLLVSQDWMSAAHNKFEKNELHTVQLMTFMVLFKPF